MPAESVGELVRRVPVLEATDTVRRAAGLMRESGATRVFVHEGNHITGTVSEQSIAGLLGRNGNLEESLDSPIQPLVEPNVTFISSRVGLVAAADMFASSGQDVLPVIDDYGSFYGAVYRSDVVGALAKTLRPPSVGGMATPLGVYLTTGSVSGGAGDLGLLLTGVSMGLMIALATAMALGIMYGISLITGFPLSAYLNSTPLTLKANPYDIPFYISTVLTVILFMVLMRLSPLAGWRGRSLS